MHAAAMAAAVVMAVAVVAAGTLEELILVVAVMAAAGTLAGLILVAVVTRCWSAGCGSRRRRVLARFYAADTIEAHFDLLGRWLAKYGRPRALYTDRHGIVEAHQEGQVDYQGQTQFSRALAELDIDLIKAHSPQAKGRVERSFGTVQDRWVKELRLAKATTLDEANAVLNRRRNAKAFIRLELVAGREMVRGAQPPFAWHLHYPPLLE
jgi:hypothetical protein